MSREMGEGLCYACLLQPQCAGRNQQLSTGSGLVGEELVRHCEEGRVQLRGGGGLDAGLRLFGGDVGWGGVWVGLMWVGLMLVGLMWVGMMWFEDISIPLGRLDCGAPQRLTPKAHQLQDEGGALL